MGMTLVEIESLQYKGSVELSDKERRHTVDIFFDPESRAVIQVIRELEKWRRLEQGGVASQTFSAAEWHDFKD